MYKFSLDAFRFEMPYNIWCDGCNSHIGMGVRYNAEKKKTGNYYTTPIYTFRMKCHLCDNYFEIQTDPQVRSFNTSFEEIDVYVIPMPFIVAIVV